MSQLSEYVPGYGPFGAKLAIIGIAPGAESVKQGKPFSEPWVPILKQDLAEAGISIDDCYRTNIFKHQLPDNEYKRYQEIGLNIQDAIADLQKELYDSPINCILGLGDPVLHALAGKSGKNNNINVWRGSILHALGKKAVFTWDPSDQMKGSGEGQWKSWQKYVRKFDVNRAVFQSGFPEFKLPQRLLHVAGSSADVYRYIERSVSNSKDNYCAVDIESIEGIPVCIGLSFQVSEGFSIPLWNYLDIDCKNTEHPKKSYSRKLRISDIPSPDLAYIWKLLANLFLNKSIRFIGQNFKYDETKLRGLGLYFHSLYWDTQIGMHCISPEMRKGLAFQQSIYTEEPYHKYEGKEFIPGKDKIEDLFLYNAKDAVVTREIFNAHLVDLATIKNGLEGAIWRMQTHKLYMDIESVGFPIDEDERKNLIHKYINWLVKLEVELFTNAQPYGLQEPINIQSPKQVDWFLYDVLKIPRRKGTGEEVITSLISNVIKKAPDKIRMCENILEQRRVSKTLGYLKASPDYDGRMKTEILITGTENFRSSNNILEPPIRPEKIGWAFQTLTKHGDIGQDLRSVLIAPRGYVIVNIDQSQAEARVCSLLADDEQTLLDYDIIDKHAYTAAKFFGGKQEQYSKKILGYECPERFVGKTLRHAYHLDIGKHEAMINVNTDARKYKIAISISEYKAGECLKILAQDTPKIKTVFHNTIQELLRGNRRIYGTFNASRYFYDEMETRDLWKGAYSFIPQQTISDKTKDVGLRTRKNLRDVQIVVESHDALTFFIREKVLDERIDEIQSYFAIPICFENCSIIRRDLVIPTDVEIGNNYKDLKKYKK